MPDPIPTPDELLEAQRKEFSEYVAVEVIYVNGARAFNPGDPVPTSHLSRGVVAQAQVAKANTKAAAAAVEGS